MSSQPPELENSPKRYDQGIIHHIAGSTGFDTNRDIGTLMAQDIETARRLIAEEQANQTGFLDLGNLGLTHLPDELFELTHLRRLNLGWFYEDESGEFQETLNSGSENSLTELPSGIAALQRMEILTICGNPIQDMGSLSGLPALIELDCSATNLNELSSIATLTTLQKLNLSNLPIRNLAHLQKLINLETLLLWETEISDLEPLKHLEALKVLNFGYTQVTTLDALATLDNLEDVDCSGSQISDLQPLADLKKLRKLDCGATKVRSLAPLQALTTLETLLAYDVEVKNLQPLQNLKKLKYLSCPESGVSDLHPLRALTELKSLTLANTKVSDLTPITQMEHLRALNCSGTPITDWRALTGLAGLTNLDLSNTEFSDLHLLDNLVALEHLECSATRVKDLAPVEKLSALQTFVCGQTAITDLHPLQSLTKLKRLNISSTPIFDLSPLQPLKSLEFLDCADTPVRDLTPLNDLPNLRTLVINGCQLDDLPQSVVESELLEHLALHETTIPGIPQEVLSDAPYSDCLRTLRAHLHDLKAGSEPIREAKLVVLGNGRVGKTQLCRHLRGLPFDEAISSTHGITVTSERWGNGDDGETLNIWDFGGQDIYHGAHTLFMKTNAVFLIVWHPDFENSVEEAVDGMRFRNYPLSYWLEYVRTLGRKDCPVIVVQTRCDRPDQEVRHLPVDGEFLQIPSLKPCWFSARTGRGRGALEDALRDAVSTLRERDGITTIGAGRMRVLQQLECWRDDDQARAISERQHRTLSQTEFHNLCEQTGGVSSPDSLLAYLHNLGVVFHQPRLFEDRIILDQSWALEAVYGVFDRSKAYPIICSQGGRFNRGLLAMTVWRHYTENEQELFLSLMESCGIVFKHREASPHYGLDVEYLAPDLLMEKAAIAQQLNGRWNDTEKTWRLEYEYPFLHPGLMRALICDVGNKSGDAGVYWKYGLWVFDQSTGCRALLEQQMENERRGRIVLKIQGARHETLARWLRERVEERNRLFGYPCIEPAVDEFPRQEDAGLRGAARGAGRDHARSELEDGTKTSKAEQIVQEPHFEKPPASFFPPEGPRVFVSYAWGDGTPDGQARQKLVETLCARLDEQGVKVRRDQDELRPGELISEFMDRLAEGDFVLTVISDKYLKSEYCMYELFRIYRNCADKPERFLGRVTPLILPDARLDEIEDRLDRADHWTERAKRLEPRIKSSMESVGTSAFRKFRLIGEFARNTSDMLELLVDKLQPRDFDRQADEGFREILAQIGRTS